MYDSAEGPGARTFAPKADPLHGKTVLVTGEAPGSFGGPLHRRSRWSVMRQKS